MKKDRTNILAVLLLCVATIGVWAQETQPAAEQAERSIVLSTEDTSAVFGRDVLLKVRYQNAGKTSWNLPDTPDKSPSNLVRYCPVELIKEKPEGYGTYLGPMTHYHIKGPDGEEIQSVWVIPPEKPISVASGKAYEYTHEWPIGWNERVIPGRWILWVEDNIADGKKKMLSNQIEVSLRFTEESMAICLAIAKNKELGVYRRKLHGRWLQKIMPALQLAWWYESSSQEEMQQGEIEIQRSLKAFGDFINDKNNAEAIAKAIEAINREAGLEPEESKSTTRPTSQPTSRPAGVLR